MFHIPCSQTYLWSKMAFRYDHNIFFPKIKIPLNPPPKYISPGGYMVAGRSIGPRGGGYYLGGILFGAGGSACFFLLCF